MLQAQKIVGKLKGLLGRTELFGSWVRSGWLHASRDIAHPRWLLRSDRLLGTLAHPVAVDPEAERLVPRSERSLGGQHEFQLADHQEVGRGGGFQQVAVSLLSHRLHSG